MEDTIKARLHRDRARLVERLREAKASQRAISDISVGHSRQQQAANYQDAIDRIDYNLRIMTNAHRT